jgi:DNA-binding winged helix-turn-helix (wHTH) protein
MDHSSGAAIGERQIHAAVGTDYRAERPADVRQAYAFAGFRYDPATGLERDGRRIPLAPTESRLLRVLLDAGGEIVTKEELVRLVWNGTPVSDNSISRAVCAVRRAVRVGTPQQVVETIYGNGFRVAVPVGLVPAPWHRGGGAIPTAHVDVIAIECVRAARDFLRRGRPADLEYAVAELDRAIRRLAGDCAPA